MNGKKAWFVICASTLTTHSPIGIPPFGITKLYSITQQFNSQTSSPKRQMAANERYKAESALMDDIFGAFG